MAPQNPAQPLPRFFSAELKWKAPSRDLDQDPILHQVLLQLALAYVPFAILMQNRALSPLNPPLQDGTRLSSESRCGSGICCICAQQVSKGRRVLKYPECGRTWCCATAPGGSRVLRAPAWPGRCWVLQQLGAALRCQASLGLCHLGSKLSLPASAGGFRLPHQLGSKAPAPWAHQAGARGNSLGREWSRAPAHGSTGPRGRLMHLRVPSSPFGSTCHRLAHPSLDP